MTPEPRPCSIARTLDIVGEKWALLAIREVFLGNRRFDEMVRQTGAPRDTLAARLRTLVAAGILERLAVFRAPGPLRVLPDRRGPRPVPGHRHPDALGRPVPSRREWPAPDPPAPLRPPAHRAGHLPGLRRTAPGPRHQGAQRQPSYRAASSGNRVGVYGRTTCPLPTTVTPRLDTTRPRARSCSLSTPTVAPSATTTCLSRMAFSTTACRLTRECSGLPPGSPGTGCAPGLRATGPSC